MIKWIDTTSVLSHGDKIFRVGDDIPDGVLDKNRVKFFIGLGQIEVIKKSHAKSGDDDEGPEE